MKRKLQFEFEKETKNTYRFKEVENNTDDVLIGSLYVKKSAFISPEGGVQEVKAPKSLIVTVETE